MRLVTFWSSFNKIHSVLYLLVAQAVLPIGSAASEYGHHTTVTAVTTGNTDTNVHYAPSLLPLKSVM